MSKRFQAACAEHFKLPQEAVEVRSGPDGTYAVLCVALNESDIVSITRKMMAIADQDLSDFLGVNEGGAK